MLRHQGRRRSFKHNIQVAVLLCLASGFVNVAGFLAFGVLTTNITGHAAFFAQNVVLGKLANGYFLAVWLLAFLLGAFFSGIFVRLSERWKSLFYLPLIVEMCILTLTALRVNEENIYLAEWWAGFILFAMGMQNALITYISGAVVRTTHLTGVVTDLGIELSHLIPGVPGHDASDTYNTALLRERVMMRLVIIVSFLGGGVMGGWLFTRYAFTSFLFAVGCILVVLVYDSILLFLKRASRRYRRR